MKFSSTFLFLSCIFLADKSIAQRAVPAQYPVGMPINFVRTWEAFAPEKDGNLLTSRPFQDVKMTTQYLDGFGRPLQTVVKKGSLETGSNATDMVTPIEYDNYGRVQHEYLPYAESVSVSGSFQVNPFVGQASFMTATFGPSSQGETWYYGQTDFEQSPINRPIEKFSPGNNWVGTSAQTTESSRHSIKSKYYLNTATDEVRIWNVVNSGFNDQFATYTSSATYNASELFKNVSQDEDGKQVVEFIDKDDRLILKKVQGSGITDAGTGTTHEGWLCTYYIYDDYNKLRCVIQPEAVKIMHNASGTPNWTLTPFLDQQCFRYEYDQRNRVTMKKVPGSGAVYMVYDSRDRLVMIQDAKMRIDNQWQINKYDQQNRITETGIWTDGSTSFSLHLIAANNSSTGYPITSSGYETLTISHYDDYSALPSGLNNYLITWNSEFSATDNSNWPYPQMPLQRATIKDMIGWTQIKVLGTATFLNKVNYYDSKNRLIQEQTTNITNGNDVKSTQYSWAGQPLIIVEKQLHSGGSGQISTIISRLTYDYGNRPIKVEKKQSHTTVNSGSMSSFKTISETAYNKLGQVKTKKLGSVASAPIEVLNYEYNIRGWQLGVNRDYARDGNNNNYFGFDLGYDKTSNSLIAGSQYAMPLYNGNITGTVWKSKGDGEKRRYDFTYDASNRILKADFTQFTGGSFNQNAGVNYNFKLGNNGDVATAYDANGNIKRMQQWGLKLNSSSQIDDLIYEYNTYSNKLRSVSELTLGATDTKLGDFTDKNISNDDYDYDVNGNLIVDKNKGITGISYNYLNLPVVITIPSKGSITYTYDAEGNKLKKTTVDNSVAGKSVTSVTSYIGGFVYDSRATVPANSPSDDYADVLQSMPQEEGRIRYKPAAGSIAASLNYDYMIKDHLGNVRMVLTEEVKQDIYPAATLEGGASTGARPVEKQFYEINEGAISDINFMPGVPVYYNNNSIPNPNPNGNENAANHYTYKLNTTSYKTGLGIVLKVMAGDKINIFGRSYYIDAANQANNDYLAPLNIINSLLSAATGVTTGKAVVSDLTGNTAGTVNPLQSYLNTHTPSATDKPRAFINYIFFDEKFEYAGGNASEVGSAYSLKQHHSDLTDIAVPKNGYIYVYCSNESNVNVWFDNLQLVHDRGAILEETHYYPFGLTMAGISSKAAGIAQNKEKTFQNQRFDDDLGLNWVQFKWRNHDPQIGRFIEIDPLSEKYVFNSTYSFSENKVTGHVELEGLEAAPTEDKRVTVPAASTVSDASKGFGFGANGQYTVFQTQKGVGIKDAKLVNPSTGKSGQVAVRTDAPHKGANYPHINENPLATGRPDPHTPITKTQFNVLNKTGNALEGISKVAKPVAIVTDALQLGWAVRTDIQQGTGGDNTIVTASKVAGGWGGAWAGAAGGAKLGIALGSLFPGPGTAVGGLVGSIIGGVVGAFIGSDAGESAGEKIVEIKNN